MLFGLVLRNKVFRGFCRSGGRGAAVLSGPSKRYDYIMRATAVSREMDEESNWQTLEVV